MERTYNNVTKMRGEYNMLKTKLTNRKVDNLGNKGLTLDYLKRHFSNVNYCNDNVCNNITNCTICSIKFPDKKYHLGKLEVLIE